MITSLRARGNRRINDSKVNTLYSIHNAISLVKSDDCYEEPGYLNFVTISYDYQQTSFSACSAGERQDGKLHTA